MKRILIAIPIMLLCLFLLPYLAFQNAKGWDVLGYFIIFFYIVNPSLAIFLGILAGSNVKLLWFLPVSSAVLFPPFYWLAVGEATPEMYLFSAIYLGISLVAALPTALIRHTILKKRQQQAAQTTQNEEK